MKRFPLLLALVFFAGACHAQLLPDQKVVDFQQLAALFAKQYAPYEWKRDALGVDLLRIAPWLDRVRATKSDLEFYEICAQYISSLNDVHSEFFLPSDFQASLGFEADLYDGQPLIETIDPDTSRAAFTMRVGDELVSVDGRTVKDWLKEFGKYTVFGNQRSTDRYNTSLITFRIQAIYPRAAEIGDDATVVVRHRASGELETYTLPWTKTGLPLTSVGPVPSPRLNSVSRQRRPLVTAGGAAPAADPPYLKPLRALQNLRLPEPKSLRGFGEVVPVYQAALPPSFVRRLGRSTDFFYSGTFQASGKRIGLLRIPDMLAFDGIDAAPFALSQFQNEVSFLQSNTDALVVDVMRNPGGNGCYVEELLRRLTPTTFRGMGEEIRVTRDWVIAFSEAIDQAQQFGEDQLVIDQLQSILAQLELAYKQNRGRTDAIPQCGTNFERAPATSAAGASLAYSKPILLLTDEFTTSAGEVFAAIFQDSSRGKLFGWRTAGAGGVVSSSIVSGFYSEGSADVTLSMLLRTNQVVSQDFGVTPYIENVGVRPDLPFDYMTEDNLLNRGKPFVDAFVAAVTALVQ
jgi:C-terminal processing protease CtpA/Prc